MTVIDEVTFPQTTIFIEHLNRMSKMKIKTHQQINRNLCGEPVAVEANKSRVTMTATVEMAVDGSGLTHGGFVFSLADHAAMIAVNHPNVVLGAAEVRFIKPVRTGDRIEANAKVEKGSGKKRNVRVTVKRGKETVFEGTFICFTLDKHVLEIDK